MKASLTKRLILATGLVIAPASALWATLQLTTNTNSVSIPFLTTDYNSSTGAAQKVLTSGNTLTILSTSGTWTLTVRALAATFTFVPSSGDSNPSKPAGDLA